MVDPSIALWQAIRQTKEALRRGSMRGVIFFAACLCQSLRTFPNDVRGSACALGDMDSCDPTSGGISTAGRSVEVAVVPAWAATGHIRMDG